MGAPEKGEEIGQVKLVRWRPQGIMISGTREGVEIETIGPARIVKEPRKRKKLGERNGRMSVRTSPQSR